MAVEDIINKPGWRWPNFQPYEVLSPDGLEQLLKGVLLINPIVLDKLEELRALIAHPILVNTPDLVYRGYRSPRENYGIVKGSRFSFHMQGLAVDISVIDFDFEKLKTAVFNSGWHGIGVYLSKKFIHCDLRPRLGKEVAMWIEK